MLFAMAYWLLKAVLTSSIENEPGSVLAAVHETVTVCPLFQPEMELMDNAEANGRRSATVLGENVENGKGELKERGPT